MCGNKQNKYDVVNKSSSSKTTAATVDSTESDIVIKTGFVIPWYKRTLTVDFFLSFVSCNNIC